jgi:acyl-CoA reductase-like NAD-dependent aldehyde dehydrogenase
MTESAVHGTLPIPEAASHRPPTSVQECDAAVAELVAHSITWSEAAPGEVSGLLERVNERLLARAPEWVTSACAAKGVPADGTFAAEEWTSVAVIARYVRLLIASLADIGRGDRPRFPGRAHPVAAGRIGVPALPYDAFDKVALAGFTADIWLRPGVSEADAVRNQAASWFGKAVPGVSLVLGAGNQASIPIVDALDRLVIHRHPVVLKMNPVNDYLGPAFEDILGELIERGVIRIVYGGSEVGTHLVHHDGIADVHVTGSDKTFAAIVYGTGEEGARRARDGDPMVTKPVTGELGNVSPVIIVPGAWSAKDIQFQAQNIASMLTQNAGFNCVALRVLVTYEGWAQRDELLDAVRAVLAETAIRPAYYPGAHERFDTFVAAHPDAERLGAQLPEPQSRASGSAGTLPWAMIPSLAPAAVDEVAFTTEAFNGVFAEVGIAAGSPGGFVQRAVDFANNRLWGTLGCSLIVHPKSMKDQDLGLHVERAIVDLRYGTVAVNHWSAVGFTLGATPWGGYPRHGAADLQSGTGFVHNALMLAEPDIEKTVVRGPFRSPVKPTWFPTNRTAGKTTEMFARLMARPSWGMLPPMVRSALRG